MDPTTRFLVSVVESSPDAIVGVDLDGRISIWNAAAERMIGYPTEAALGRDLMHLVPADQSDGARAMLARVRNGETVERRSVKRLRHDGSTIVADLTLAPVRDADGEICGSVGILRDVTERTEVEELLRRNDRLASIGRTAAGIAHEINNPLGGILMAAQYAKSSLERDEAGDIVRQALDHIEADAKRCGDILRDLLRAAASDSLDADGEPSTAGNEIHRE